jgi:hypothetical protein
MTTREVIMCDGCGEVIPGDEEHVNIEGVLRLCADKPIGDFCGAECIAKWVSKTSKELNS